MLLLACATFVPPAMGQTVYKCGNAYSQSPCPGAVPVDASDSRTPAQKAQTDAAAAQAAKTAAKMEKDRLALEKTAAAKPPKKPASSPQANAKDASEPASKTSAKPGAKRKKPAPEYFTATVPPEKKASKKATAKSGDKAQAAKSEETPKP